MSKNVILKIQTNSYDEYNINNSTSYQGCQEIVGKVLRPTYINYDF